MLFALGLAEVIHLAWHPEHGMTDICTRLKGMKLSSTLPIFFPAASNCAHLGDIILACVCKTPGTFLDNCPTVCLILVHRSPC